MDGEEEKKVDTQTTETATNTNDNSQNANRDEGNTQDESKTENEGQRNEQQIDDTDTKVANAFGNVDDTNKTEEKKGKKANSVAQTNEDGSITFKSQEELEGFINKTFRKGAKSAEQKTNDENEGNMQDNTESDTNNGNNNKNEVEQEKEKTSQTTVDMTADIALALVEADIDPKKARRAARLVDPNKVIVQGTIDTAKLQEEINALVAEWPELKSKAIENQGSNAGFKFGASQENDSNSEEAEISKIFGNSQE